MTMCSARHSWRLLQRTAGSQCPSEGGNLLGLALGETSQRRSLFSARRQLLRHRPDCSLRLGKGALCVAARHLRLVRCADEEAGRQLKLTHYGVNVTLRRR